MREEKQTLTVSEAHELMLNYKGELTIVGKCIFDLHTGEVWEVVR